MGLGYGLGWIWVIRQLTYTWEKGERMKDWLLSDYFSRNNEAIHLLVIFCYSSIDLAILTRRQKCPPRPHSFKIPSPHVLTTIPPSDLKAKGTSDHAYLVNIYSSHLYSAIAPLIATEIECSRHLHSQHQPALESKQPDSELAKWVMLLLTTFGAEGGIGIWCVVSIQHTTKSYLSSIGCLRNWINCIAFSSVDEKGCRCNTDWMWRKMWRKMWRYEV